MFPERQLGPHREWKQEVEYLDGIFTNGAAYTVGKVNGDHWLLYMTNPDEINSENVCTFPIDQPDDAVENLLPDYTIEILMSNLATTARRPFFSSLSPSDDPHAHAAALSEALGISRIFPPNLTTLDAYSFSPCGYSANALVKWGGTPSDADPSYLLDGTKSDRTSQNIQTREGYYTIHVTPEEGWSYASFECNVPSHASGSTESIPDLKSLVQRVAAIFKPGRLSLTLFISNLENDDGQGESVEAAQRAFKMALADPDLSQRGECIGLDKSHRKGINGVGGQKYRRTEKINYEFGGYDLAFASFELMS
ncbi:S-adenosylmethionine decarboxylase [Collybia nuda]|uniref:S-adenosylmethionine decarboxylase n=1 Tax=Collybia nuda TaxID=64659 RepID=A0A9P6CAH7_9AGAR|nr:S-adenosylmethionine decarboxylase [Collybia nuda]